MATFQFHFSDVIEMNFAQICAFQCAKIKRCFEIIISRLTIFSFKIVKINIKENKCFECSFI